MGKIIKCRPLWAIAAIFGLGLPSARAEAPKLPWMHEGACLTFTWVQELAPGNGSDYKCDENGDWVVAGTGQHYTRTDQHGTSGSGWNQLTIAAIDGDRAVVASQGFGDVRALGKPAPVPLQGNSFVTPIDQAGDYWISPDKLATLHTDAGNGVLVDKVQWKSGEQTIPAIRVQVVGSNSYALHVFDPKTGICLHFATSVRGAPPRIVGPGDMGQGDVTLAHGDFVSLRDLKIPWAGDPAPAWVANLKALHYHGNVVSQGALPTVPTNIAFDTTISNHGANWVQIDATTTMQMQGAPPIPPSKSSMAFGRAQFNSLWINPTSLTNLHQGDVLDEDPVTQMRITVTRSDANSVVICQKNASGQITSEYDKSTGILNSSSFVNCLSQQLLTLKLQNKE